MNTKKDLPVLPDGYSWDDYFGHTMIKRYYENGLWAFEDFTYEGIWVDDQGDLAVWWSADDKINSELDQPFTRYWPVNIVRILLSLPEYQDLK